MIFSNPDSYISITHPATVIVTLFSLWRLAPMVHATPVLITTSFSLWHHLHAHRYGSTYGRTYGHLTALNI